MADSDLYPTVYHCPPGQFQRHPHNHELCLRMWPRDVRDAWVAGGQLKIKVRLMSPRGKAPSVAYPGDAGMDLFSAENVVIAAGSTGRVQLDVAVQLPAGYSAMFMGRSSSVARGLIVHSTLIDWGYRGPLFAMVQNIRDTHQVVSAGDRIAQLVPFPAHLPLMSMVQVDELDPSDRGINGVGSSGR